MTPSNSKFFDAMQQATTSDATSIAGSSILDTPQLTANCWEEGDELLPSGD